MPDVWHIRTIRHTRHEPETMTGEGGVCVNVPEPSTLEAVMIDSLLMLPSTTYIRLPHYGGRDDLCAVVYVDRYIDLPTIQNSTHSPSMWLHHIHPSSTDDP